jgi:hypothetical protein
MFFTKCNKRGKIEHFAFFSTALTELSLWMKLGDDGKFELCLCAHRPCLWETIPNSRLQHWK